MKGNAGSANYNKWSSLFQVAISQGKEICRADVSRLARQIVLDRPKLVDYMACRANVKKQGSTNLFPRGRTCMYWVTITMDLTGEGSIC